jgi:hypothetical protein
LRSGKNDRGSRSSPGDLLALVGTRKGAFILTGDRSRRRWQISGPYNPGTDVFHLLYDPRAGGRVYPPATEWGQCPHKLLPQSTTPDRLYQQNHCGVFRTDNYGEGWADITEGLNSRFGFVPGLHPRDPSPLS